MIAVILFSLDKLLVVLHVAHKDGIDGPEQPPEALAVEGDHLQARLCDDVGGAWLIFEQSALAEIISFLIVVDEHGRFAGFECLGSLGLSAHDHKEGVAFLALCDHVITLLIPLLMDCISQLRSLIRLHVLQNGNLRQELLILFSLLLGRIFHDVVKGASVESPEFRRL